MKVLLLSPYPEMLHHAFCEAGDTCTNSNGYLVTDANTKAYYDFIVCFGYRYILKDPLLSIYKNKIINIHISLLPWNRGADPNFWSWFDDTPKGVSIHRIDAGIDTGGILVQEELKKWHSDETLHSSWHHLMGRAKALFESEWKNIRRDGLATRHVIGGTYHKMADKGQWMEQLPQGWLTPVKEVQRLGREYRKAQDETKDRHPRARKHRQQTFKEL